MSFRGGLQNREDLFFEFRLGFLPGHEAIDLVQQDGLNRVPAGRFALIDEVLQQLGFQRGVDLFAGVVGVGPGARAGDLTRFDFLVSDLGGQVSGAFRSLQRLDSSAPLPAGADDVFFSSTIQPTV